MSRNKALIFIVGAAAIVVVVLAVTVGGGSDNGTAAAGPPKTASGGTATIGVESNGSLGRILVDSRGRTVYLFEKDTGPKSTCSGDCAVDWPPVTTSGKPTVGNGVTPSMVGTTSRSDGTTQVTYNGHPLYLFEGDPNPGDTNGQGLNAFGARWFVLSPAGNAVMSQGSTDTSNSRGY
jgi:predicted lipoprotein with Yx(FWY)xxD motif